MMCSSGDIVDCLHGEALLCSLNEQRMQGSLCDVTIVVEDTKFKAHRNILAASSLYFRNQFLSQSILIQGHVLELTDFKADTFTEILNYIYSSKVAIKRKEALSDLADAGKKLGITFLENIKTSTQSCKRSSSSSVHAQSSETEENMAVPLYRGQNTLKSEGVEKKRDDPAEASGPRITNAFSILETEVSVFSPLDLRANFKKSSGTTTDVNCRVDCENSACNDGESVNTLAEHSYAVSSGDADVKRDSVFDHGNKNDHSRAEESTISHSVSTIQETKPASNLPLLEPQCFTPQTKIQSGTLATNVNSPAVGDQIAKPTDFCNSRENEGHLPQLPLGNSHVAQPFPDQAIYGYSKKQQDIYHCKNCSKEFAHLKRLQRHEQICFKVVHTEKDIRLSSRFSGDITADNFCTSSDQNNLSSITSPGTDHFVKIIDGKIFYVCIVCKRNYVTLSSLRRHSNVHSWRKSYPCHYCNKVFALAEYRTKHEIWHTGDRRYQCIFCLETFMTYYILKNHQKSSHGIDPRLGVGNKTNRGIKPSIYPYKLYRLLPMKCRRAPLRNSANGATENTGTHFQGPGSFNATSVVQNTLSCQPFALETRDSFSSTLDAPSQSISKSTTNQDVWPFDILHSANDLPAVTHNSEIDSAPKENDNIVSPSCNMEHNMPSIINCTTSAPSVIMHSSRVSSVIMHGNSIAGTTTTNGIGWYNDRTNVSVEKENTYQDINKVFVDSQPTREEEKIEEDKAKETPQEKRGVSVSSSKKNKSVIQKGNKTETYIAKPALPGTLVNSGIAPLCQITVKIGSEALVKRQISGSSLFFRKSGRPKHSEVKAKKATVLHSDEEKKERSSVRLRRTESLKMEEMYDDTSDHDVSDKPWRPYYNYKPKKKSKHLKKFRKLKKRKKHNRLQAVEEKISKADIKCSSKNAVEENENSVAENIQTVDFKCTETTIEEEEMETAEDWQLATKSYFCELCQKSFRNPSTLKVHMRCHTGEKPYPCKTCGKSFSFPGNVTKHERIHQSVRNYTCQYCSKSFMLNESLKKHERIHTGEKMYNCQFCPQQFLYLCTKKNHEQRHLAERSVKGFVCIHCSKVCKTAAALGMHQKKHYLRSKKQKERKEFPVIGNWGVFSNPNCKDLETTKDKETREMSENFPSSFHDNDTPLLTFNSNVAEIVPQNVSAIGMVENVDTGAELDHNFMTPPPPPLPLPPATLHESVLIEFPKSWKHWKTRQYSLEESLNSDHSSTRECTKTFTELKTMTNFDNPFVP
ncbi:zinc finger and BTB domain-containing protein 38 [Spea bombifrons]|uniref:zinc finger and BTB domain-containing protein 38 n=1 Tax=Spea bombifrons TaxID=233779 RepID=UPI00234A4BC6|nr:zinc finger and BTB domain-containing protein 38 [Spea bombifrons]